MWSKWRKRTIRVLDDIQESGIIIDGQDITIDLNGKTISSDNQEATIINHGSLQIVDNSDSKTGKIINTKSIGNQKWWYINSWRKWSRSNKYANNRRRNIWNR